MRKWSLQQYIYKGIICISDICMQSVSKLSEVLKNPVDEISPFKIVISYNNKNTCFHAAESDYFIGDKCIQVFMKIK